MRSAATARIGLRRVAASIEYTFSSLRRALAATTVAIATFALLLASSYPSFSVRTLLAGPGNWEHTFRVLLFVLVEGAGATGIALATTYAGLTGVLVVVVARGLRTAGSSSVVDLSGALPGLLLSGCASCGAGLLGLLGATGAVAVLPFHGNGLRAVGVALLVVLLARTGDPRRCHTVENRA